ncbi:hypothetical protein I4U23_029689 [Adineta vaga]|nr:hypothetical protein I4U23_029689 [Adineta vaga]
MKVRRRNRVAKSETDREYLVDNNTTEHEPSKARRLLWRFAKGTWKALKIGFQTAVGSQPFAIALEPTAVATTIIEYRMYRRAHR